MGTDSVRYSWLWKIEVIQLVVDATERAVTAAGKWSGLEKNEKHRYALIEFIIIIAVITFQSW